MCYKCMQTFLYLFNYTCNKYYYLYKNTNHKQNAQRVLSSIVTHSYIFRPYWVETCRNVLQLMIKLFVHFVGD
jgi:hypothetical protein